ncbi:cache domain-containing protein [Paenibacillus hexagrammi]|uniref:Cache domain-containing protein n=1 Tax=Paenibacillus hexagrammi TaxID=2908839 RepID=A0ABY3SET1_9BACL|nr:cache domain-containing protein [Paenibacillus sp. YPD9-1]UJF31940.1 cache domain-containing protein [Paenibacillus sp. YPD9-1]
MKSGLEKITSTLAKLGKSCLNVIRKVKWGRWFSKDSKINGVIKEMKLGEKSKNVSSAAWKEMRQMKLENPVKSVGMKLFFMFFFSILIGVLAVGLVSYSISKGVIKNKVSDSSVQTITQAGQKMDFLFSTFDDTTLQIMLNKDIQDLLDKQTGLDKGSYEYLDLTRQLSDKLNTVIFSNKSIKSLHMYRPDGTLIIISGAGGSTLAGNVDEQDWFKKIMDANGKVVWLDSKTTGYSSNSSNTFAVGRVMRNTLTNSTSGILVLELSTELLSKEVSGISLGREAVWCSSTPPISSLQQQITREWEKILLCSFLRSSRLWKKAPLRIKTII